MWIADDPNRRISDWQAIRPEKQRVRLVATRSRSAQRVDVLVRRAHARHCDVRCATAMHETGADDDARRVANDVGSFSFVRSESFQQIEDLSAAQIGNLAPIASELNA